MPDVPAPELRLEWPQVHRFRLHRHGLLPPRARPSLGEVVRRMGGAQAQLHGAAQLSLRARVTGLTPAEIESALWKEHRLARAWAMRRTVFLLPVRDLATFVRGSARRADKEITWAVNAGVPPATVEATVAAVLDALKEPRTLAELAREVGRTLGRPVRAARGGGWGSSRRIPGVVIGRWTFPAGYLLHLAGSQGVVCTGEPDGPNTRYVQAASMFGRWHDLPAGAAEERLLDLYLAGFGPANPADFSLWTGLRLRDARAIWQRVAPALARVDVDGWTGWARHQDLDELGAPSDEPLGAKLLPYFDSYLIAHTDRRHLVEPPHHASVFRPQGWTYPTILDAGRVAGTWSHELKAGKLQLRLRAFRPLSRPSWAELRSEARDVARFLGAASLSVTVERGPPA